MDNRIKQKDEDIDFHEVNSPNKLIETLSNISTNNLRNMVEATNFQPWYEMEYRNRNNDPKFLTRAQFLTQVSYALTTSNITTLDPETLQKALKKFEEDLPGNIRDSLLMVCKIVRLVKSNTPKEDIIGTLRSLSKDSFVNLQGLDLSGVTLKFRPDLSGFNLMGVNMSGCTLEQIGLRQANLIKTNLSGSQLEGIDFAGALMLNADLSKATLKGANFRRANLTDADLSRSDLTDANLSGAILINANLLGATLNGTNLTDVTLLSSESFDNLKETILDFHNQYKDHKNYDILLAALVENIIKVAENKNIVDSSTANQWIDTTIELAQALDSANKASSRSEVFSRPVNIEPLLKKLNDCKDHISRIQNDPTDQTSLTDFDYDDLTAKFEKLKSKKS